MVAVMNMMFVVYTTGNDGSVSDKKLNASFEIVQMSNSYICLLCLAMIVPMRRLVERINYPFLMLLATTSKIGISLYI